MRDRSKPSTYEIERDRATYSKMSCCDKILLKCVSKCCLIATCIGILLVALFLLALGVTIGVIVYEVEFNSEPTIEDCEIVNYNNVFVGDIDKVDSYCLNYYNISKVFTVGNDLTLISDCQFEITEDDNQLILNKLNDTSKIILDWITQDLNIIILDDNLNSGPAIIFAYLLSIGKPFEDAQALINKIPDVDISYNFMQQLRYFDYTIQTGDLLSDYELKLLWTKTDNIITCQDI